MWLRIASWQRHTIGFMSDCQNRKEQCPTQWDMVLYWKDEEPGWIPEISQGFYYCQTNFINGSFKCWRRKGFLFYPAKQNLFLTQPRSTGNSWFNHNGQTSKQWTAIFPRHRFLGKCSFHQRRELGITISCIANSEYIA